MITRSRGIELLSFLRFHIIHTILILANKKMPFDQMARPNVEITLLQDNMMEITITGMILLLLRRLNILNYTDYVAEVFKTRGFTGGSTDTAGAIRRVRIEDLPKTRSEQTFIMIFTDGNSNNYASTVQESKLLHPLVDEVYAFGIGNGIDERELKEIASSESNWATMGDFKQYIEYIRLFMLDQDGCKTPRIQPYRIIDLATPDFALSYGASSLTTVQYPELKCEGSCPEYPENSREFECAQCSAQIGALDLEAMEVFRHNITEAAKVGSLSLDEKDLVIFVRLSVSMRHY